MNDDKKETKLNKVNKRKKCPVFCKSYMTCDKRIRNKREEIKVCDQAR